MHLNSEWYKPEISRKDLKNLAKRKDLPGILHMIIYFASLGISGYLAYYFIDSYLCLIFFFIYGTIWAFSVSNWHETVHRTAFKTRWLNEIVYHISCFMGDFEAYRWRWSHTFHHSNTYQTKDDYDHEIQITRPTELLAFFLNFIPFADLLFPHKLLKYEIIKHSFRKFSPVIAITAPDSEKNKIVWNSRFYVFLWLVIIAYSFWIGSILPVIYILLPNYYGKPIQFFVNVTQHLGAPFDKKDHRESTYSVKINPIFAFLYWDMQYHLEHHMFPTIPSYNLKKLNHLIKDQIPKPFPSLFSFYWNVMPIVIKQATNPEAYYKTNIPQN